MSAARKITYLAAALIATGLASGAMAQEWTDPYAVAGSGFEGLYVGVIGGGNFDPSSSHLTAPDTLAGTVGGVAGVNMYITDTVVGGLEIQAAANVGATATVYDAFALGKLGVAPSDDIMFYGAGGPGWVNGAWGYGVGGGAEMIVTDNIGVRGEALAIGNFGAMPDSVKVTGGAIFHLD